MECLKKMVIMPDSRFKIFWNIVTIILLIYTAIFVPYNVAFSESEDKSLVQTIIDYVIDVLFTIDIFINFISGYEDLTEGKVITDLRKIAKLYLRSWFVPDLLACVPFGLFTPKGNASANSSKLIRLSRLPRLYRLIRIIRMLKMIKILKNSETINIIQERLGSSVAGLRLLNIVGLTFYLVHLIACLWYGWANFIGFPFNCWVAAQVHVKGEEKK
jgi:hypothetical protein